LRCGCCPCSANDERAADTRPPSGGQDRCPSRPGRPVTPNGPRTGVDEAGPGSHPRLDHDHGAAGADTAGRFAQELAGVAEMVEHVRHDDAPQQGVGERQVVRVHHAVHARDREDVRGDQARSVTTLCYRLGGTEIGISRTSEPCAKLESHSHL
jgi:hypothetical protein